MSLKVVCMVMVYLLYMWVGFCVVLDAEGEGSSKFLRSTSMPASPATPSTPITPTTPGSMPRRDNVWRSVFNPGSNLATKTLGAHQIFDKPEPNSPTVYDWYVQNIPCKE
jgi:hypothetical protein